MRGSITRVTMLGCCSAWCEASSIIWEHCCATWGEDETNLRLQIGDKLIQGMQSRSSSLLRGRYHKKQLDALKAAIDQGKSFHSVSKYPSSSKWIGNGKYMSFADYRFAIKGRLNQLPLQTVLKKTNRLRGFIHC